MKIGFVGLGIMGRPMALNILKGGFDLTVWARRAESMAPLLEAGIHIRRLGTPPAPQGRGELIVHPITPQPIGVVTIYPGISADVVRNFLRQQDALVAAAAADPAA